MKIDYLPPQIHSTSSTKILYGACLSGEAAPHPACASGQSAEGLGSCSQGFSAESMCVTGTAAEKSCSSGTAK